MPFVLSLYVSLFIVSIMSTSNQRAFYRCNDYGFLYVFCISCWIYAAGILYNRMPLKLSFLCTVSFYPNTTRRQHKRFLFPHRAFSACGYPLSCACNSCQSPTYTRLSIYARHSPLKTGMLVSIIHLPRPVSPSITLMQQLPRFSSVLKSFQLTPFSVMSMSWI